MKKPNVIFLGAFKSAAADGTIGGQAFACICLVESPLSERVEWLLIDSTQRSQPPPGFLVRLFFAGCRAAKAMWWLVTRRVQATFIFTRYEFSSFLEKGLIAIAASFLGRRSVISIRSEVRSFGSDRYTTFFRNIVVNCCDSIICQSEEAAQELMSRLKCPREKIEVVPNWIDSQKYLVENRSTDDSRPVHFLFMGWLEPFKGVRHLIDAAKQLKDANLEFRISLCGGGTEEESLKELCRDAGLKDSINFLGWVSGEAKSKALAEADVLVLPSYSEGMPNSVLEAMASGMGVIATPVGGVPTLIASEKQGFLVEVGEVDGVAKFMKRFIDDRQLARNMGKKNQAVVLQRHDVESVWPVVARVLGVEKE